MTPSSYCPSMDYAGSLKEITPGVIDEANSIEGNVARIVPGQGRAIRGVEPAEEGMCDDSVILYPVLGVSPASLKKFRRKYSDLTFHRTLGT